MAANDVIRSGARPILISDAIHISKSEPDRVQQLVSGVKEGAKAAGGLLVSGETGDVAEILHNEIEKKSPPFDLFVSCLGLASRNQIIAGDISPGDRVIGLRSSGIHSNGLTLARRVLLKQWGGRYEKWETPTGLEHPVLEELLIPTRIFVNDLKCIQEIAKVKAAVHITGDGFAKFKRLLEWKNGGKRPGLGFRFKLKERPSPIFDLIHKTSKFIGSPISLKEMYSTFNMGYGFAVIVSPADATIILDSLNMKTGAVDIGFVSKDGAISVDPPGAEKPILL